MPDSLDRHVFAGRIVKRLIVIAAVVLLWSILIAYNISALREAFGSGSPYYGRSTNMDKWQDPRAAVASVDIVAVLATIVMATRFLRARRERGE
jgi:hypothetical protein